MDIFKQKLTLLALSAVCVLLVWTPPALAGQWTDTDVFVDTTNAAYLISQGAAVVDARESRDFRAGHIPQAANLHWQDFVDGSTSGEIIDDDRHLSSLLGNAGVSSERPVIVYGNWSQEGAWGEEGRLYWTLEYLGHSQVYILEGGLAGWQEVGGPVERGSRAPSADERSDFAIDRQHERRVSTDELRHRLSNSDSLVLLDTREKEEYAGQIKYGEQRSGHIPGAKHLWWRDLLDDDGHLKSRDKIQGILADLGIAKDSQIVAYCTGGVRSGFVYAVLRAAGFEAVQNYDASMWDWTRRDDTPLQ